MSPHPPYRDLAFIGIGLALSVIVPTMLAAALGPNIQAPASFVVIALSVSCGLAAIAVGFGSLAGLLTSREQCRMVLLTISGSGLLLGLLIAVYSIVWGRAVVDFRPGGAPTDFASLFRFSPIRLAAAVFGVGIAVHHAMKEPHHDSQRALVLGILGGLFGWIAAYPLLAFGLLRLLYPQLMKWWSRPPSTGSRSTQPMLLSPPAIPLARIEELRKRINWVRQQNLPQHIVQTEVARLENEIRQLGGTP